MMSTIGSLVSTNIDFLRQPPYAPIFILVLTLVVNMVMSYANKRSMDLPAYRKMMVESSRARKELMEAMKTGNQRRISQAQKKQNDLMKEQQKASSGRMKLTLYVMIPFILIWQVLNSFFGKTIVAYMPFKVPFFPENLIIGNWYLLCSISVNIVLSRIIGLTFEIDPDDRE
ncbi:hypothetical protein CL673_04320 [Candidatus Bathyarchaeota archaeon]|jgi:uncharacterized membrane protein (DUF106 family)|nr:hypothetical protein [Candidatus Bathyarchaeota archaeon]MDP6049129.1 EMC3/TMCO1 family protein [Candidatus Bathyarchaeota archaeon]MDP7443491.1 EMC3/TMCO1 family protein [Candidatus Bathyarchaeota archaeon]|tara:strand:- start:338 stop:853 length:516 start_codon:yes stop_codon:yes gene_type:complete